MTDLLPCPFCRSTNLRHEFTGSQGFIECNECGAAGPCDEQAADPICDHDAACDAWNRRACAGAGGGGGVGGVVARHSGCSAHPAATLLQQLSAPAPVAAPVPVSERLPGPEDCLDEGWAWFFNKRIGWRQAVLPVSPGYTHWLPANGLPLPAPEGEDSQP